MAASLFSVSSPSSYLPNIFGRSVYIEVVGLKESILRPLGAVISINRSIH